MWAAITRWFTADALTSILWGVAGVGLLTGAYIAYADWKGGIKASADLACLQSNVAANEQATKHVADLDEASEAASEIERAKQRSDGGRAVVRALAIERALKALPDNPVCFPKSLSEALSQ